ncbi:akap7 2 5 rna ligase-like domain protein [Cystoisospora suis]|uniref:Akap7 2 5 rna ligase-like domain protein n=1 Tax=Cystoisospora suis TaxID=483139 RepID=A0A2C6LH35_9APIC|nr:akap7 2 5 rna ligase-like domain protein [Cystoisospora suis]
MEEDVDSLPSCFLRPQFQAVNIGKSVYRTIIQTPESQQFDLAVWDQNETLRKWREKRNGTRSSGGLGFPPSRGWEDDDLYADDVQGLAFDDKRGLWTIHFSLSEEYHQVLLDRGEGRRDTFKQLEKDLGVRVHLALPPDAEVTIESKDRDAVISAKVEVEFILEEILSNMRYTHFVCLPMTDPKLLDRFEIFRSQLKTSFPDLDDTLFISPRRLHFTILLLKLPTKQDEEECKRVLESLSPAVYDAVDTRTMLLHLKGLFIMNDDPKAAHVVYTTQYDGNAGDQEVLLRLNRLCEVLIDGFRKAGLVTDDELRDQRVLDSNGEKISVKLHATILNTTYQQRYARRHCKKTGGGGEGEESAEASTEKKRQKLLQAARKGFDASSILQQFRLFDFLNAKSTCVSLCSLSGTRAGAAANPDGFYHTVASIRLP